MTIEQDFETVLGMLITPRAFSPRDFDRARDALSRIEKENERLQRLVDEHDGPGYTYELDKLIADNERLRPALEQIAALDAETATDCWYIARQALDKA
jgi:uncharacterized protein YdcH (DUF465 family)